MYYLKVVIILGKKMKSYSHANQEGPRWWFPYFMPELQREKVMGWGGISQQARAK